MRAIHSSTAFRVSTPPTYRRHRSGPTLAFRIPSSTTGVAYRSVVTSALQLFSQFAIIGGGLWAVWGVVTLAGGLKDQNGPATQSGVWQVVGGGLIIAAAALFSNIAL